jgi:hypothetical protein
MAMPCLLFSRAAIRSFVRLQAESAFFMRYAALITYAALVRLY